MEKMFQQFAINFFIINFFKIAKSLPMEFKSIFKLEKIIFFNWNCISRTGSINSYRKNTDYQCPFVFKNYIVDVFGDFDNIVIWKDKFDLTPSILEFI